MKINGTTSSISYNEYCPWDSVNQARSVTGCNNTAAGQILYYYIEKQGLDLQLSLSGADAYTSSCNGVTIEISGTTAGAAQNGYLDFDSVNQYLADFSLTSAEDIAALCFAAGVVQQSRYNANGTGTVWNTDVFLRAGMAGASIYWGGNTNNYLVDFENKVNVDGSNSMVYTMTDAAFEILIDELNSGRVVGTSYPGHALVIDGYDAATDKFHINYGWGDEAYVVNNYTRWYSREEMRADQYKNFIVDLYVNYDNKNAITVSDPDVYGTGTLLRAIDMASGIVGENTIKFSADVKDVAIDPHCAVYTDGDLVFDSFSMNVNFSQGGGFYGYDALTFNGGTGKLFSVETLINENNIVISDYSGAMVA